MTIETYLRLHIDIDELECQTFERWVKIHGYYFKLKRWREEHGVE